MTQLPYKLTRGEQDVLDERRAQVTREGYFSRADDEHVGFELSMASECYLRGAVLAGRYPHVDPVAIQPGGEWPFKREAWKPSTARRMLVKAIALAHAELDRMDRAEARKGGAA